MRDNKKICCIFNVAPHYNESIYKLMDMELECDFFLGDKLPYSIELMNYHDLKGFKYTLQNKNLLGNFYWQKGALQTLFDNYEYYIITGEPYCLSTWILLIANKIKKRKSYLWTHGWYGNERKIKKIVKKLFFKLSDRILLYGDYAKGLMINDGFKAECLIPVYNSLNYDQQIEIRSSIKKTNIYFDYFQNNNPIILYVGRIQKRKKIDLLIDAIKELNINKIECNLIVIGKIIDETDFSQLIEKNNLNKKIWQFGPCYDERILSELIYNADLCVVPGDIGLTAIHSLVYGTPVITHNNFPNHGPEFEVITPGLNGDFFEENSVSDLSDKIKKWINFDENKRELTRIECYNEIKEKFNPNVQIEIFKHLFNIN